MPETLKETRPLLTGGPRDGSRIGRGTRPNFIYVGGPLEKPRVFREAGRGRDLYRLDRVVDGVARYIYAGHSHRRCDGCQGFVSAKPRCPLCGYTMPSKDAAAR